MVEQSAVNRLVVGSNPTWGEKSPSLNDLNKSFIKFDLTTFKILDIIYISIFNLNILYFKYKTIKKAG